MTTKKGQTRSHHFSHGQFSPPKLSNSANSEIHNGVKGKSKDLVKINKGNNKRKHDGIKVESDV